MPRRKAGQVRREHGTMCNICGRNCGRGGPLNAHLKSHGIAYADYMKCFYPSGRGRKRVIADAWNDSHVTRDGKVMIHVLVRRFVGDPGPRGVARSGR